MQKKFTAALVLCAALLSASCAEEVTTEEYLANAEMLVESGDYNGALIQLKNAAQQAPFDMRVRRSMAYAYLGMGLGADAEKEARRAREMGMQDEEASLLITRALMLQGKFEELLAEADEFAAESGPQVQSEVLAWRGLALIELEDFEVAARTLEAALKLDPDSAIALAATASYEARTGNADRARHWVEKALQADPDSPDALALQGDLLAAEGDLEGARDAYTRSIDNRGYPTLVNARRAMANLRLDNLAAAQVDVGALRRAGLGKLAYVHQVRGLLLLLQENYADASIELQKGLEAAPRNVPMKAYLAASLLQQERFEQAAVVLDRLNAQVPRSYNVARMRANLAVQTADLQAAQDILQGVLAGSGEESPELLGMLGAVAMIEGDADSAVQYYERVLALEPDNEKAQQALREARSVRGDFIERDLQAVQQSVDEGQYMDVLMSAAAALKQGRTDDALRIAQGLQRQYPQRSDPLKVAAAAQMIAGDLAAGRATMEAVLAIDPLDPSTTRNLAKLYGATGEEERARSLLGNYLEAEPDDSLARAILAGLVARSEAPKTAAAELEDLLAAEPGNLSVRGRLVKLRFEAAEYDQVIVLTEQLKGGWIAAQPSLVELRGKAFVNLGQADMALGTWKQWAEAAPDSVLANYYYADGLAAQGQFDAARAALDRAVTNNPAYLPGRVAQVRMAALGGDLAGARQLMDKLQADVQGERVEVWRTAGWLAVQEQRYPQAEEAFRRALAIEPDAETALLLAVTQSTDGRGEAARQTLAQWRQTFPRDLRLLAMQAQGALGDDPEQARALYLEMLQVAPSSIMALNNLAMLERERDLEQALSYAARAHELLPEDPVVMDTYGQLLADSGKLVAGGKLLREAVEAQPGNLQYRLNYADVLLRQGRNGEARRQLQAVVDGEGAEPVQRRARELLSSLPAD